ncbi:hypothetical protein L596_019283 [Steinernema carpocapsae]|uniref:Uncharacterized protein n=1 Tax=Steinernema carpocapsae TaxID=34508 RepID=A0A4U5MQ39_STECR|nr:hypothetical protein L596_019283 [Steinernema carpocapsae]
MRSLLLSIALPLVVTFFIQYGLHKFYEVPKEEAEGECCVKEENPTNDRFYWRVLFNRIIFIAYFQFGQRRWLADKSFFT